MPGFYCVCCPKKIPDKGKIPDIVHAECNGFYSVAIYEISDKKVFFFQTGQSFQNS